MNGIPERGTGRHEDYLTRLDEQRAADALPPSPEYLAYEAYVMAAPDDQMFPEYEDLEDWEKRAIGAAVDAGYEARARLADAQERPAPELAALTAERDGLRKSLHAIELGIAEPSPQSVARDALNGRYFDPGTDAGVWNLNAAARPSAACPDCGSQERAERGYVPGFTGMPVGCVSDWHDREDDAAPAPGPAVRLAPGEDPADNLTPAEREDYLRWRAEKGLGS